MAKRKYEPMRTVYAIQQQLASGAWETKKLFYTDEWAQAHIAKNGYGADFRVEPVLREIYD